MFTTSSHYRLRASRCSTSPKSSRFIPTGILNEDPSLQNAQAQDAENHRFGSRCFFLNSIELCGQGELSPRQRGGQGQLERKSRNQGYRFSQGLQLLAPTLQIAAPKLELERQLRLRSWSHSWTRTHACRQGYRRLVGGCFQRKWCE
jgi:hypothetical protein